MALHLNFYHEIQKDAQVRARDPIKLAGFAVAGIAVLLMGYYFYRSSQVEKVLSLYRERQAEWRKLEPLMKKTTARQKELEVMHRRNAQLVKRLKGRFYWAPLLQRLAEGTPPEVQITSLEGKWDGKAMSILLKGFAAGENPRQAAEQFRSSLEGRLGEAYAEARVTFDGNSLEEVSRTVQLKGKALQLARFGMRITFTQKEAPDPEKTAEATPKTTASTPKANQP